MMRRRAASLLLVLASAGCRATSLSELDRLSEAPPASYSVFVSGGAFLEVDPRQAAPARLMRTWPELAEGVEAFPLTAMLDALRTGRAFVAVEGDANPVEVRQAFAKLAMTVPSYAEDVQTVLATARSHGHDLVLVVERLRDGSIEQRGINDQWPITAIAWLAIGLGILIPDHTYESRASLRVTLREVHTGELLYQAPLSGGPVDLSLWERGSFLGILTSIVVPPFLVGDNDDTVVQTVRDLTTRRLLVSLVRQLKSPEFRERIGERVPATILVDRRGNRAEIQVDARESLGVVRLRVDGANLDQVAAKDFEARLLASEAQGNGRWRYAADLAIGRASRRLQVIVQTVAGRVASVTVPLEGAR